MKKTIPKLLTLVCLLVAVMGLSIVTVHAATVTGTVSSGNEYRYHEDKTPVSQWGPYTSNKLKYFTRNDTGETVPAYCMEPEVRSASGDLQYSSTSWSDLTWNQRYAVTLAMAYGYGGNYGFNMHPDCAQLATQAVVWEFVCGYRSPVYPYALYDTTCANLFHYAGDDVAVAYNIIIDRIMNHGKIPSFAVKYRNQLSGATRWTSNRPKSAGTSRSGRSCWVPFVCPTMRSAPTPVRMWFRTFSFSKSVTVPLRSNRIGYTSARTRMALPSTAILLTTRR